MIRPSGDSAPSGFEIVLVAGPDSGRIIPLTERKHTLGRSPSSGIRINDPSLEPHHALLTGFEMSGIHLSETFLQSAIQPLGGPVEIEGSTFRVGSTVCWVLPAITPSIIDQPSVASRPFHRSPQALIEELEPPVMPEKKERPSRSAPPPWGAIAGGVATGLIIAVITGQWLFGMFSLVTAGISGMTWMIQRIGHRRSMRRWSVAIERDRELFDRQCLHFARHLAARRRDRHRLLGEMYRAALLGDDVLWAKRNISDVCIGFGSRQVVVVPGAPPLAFNDIPVTINVSPGRIIGIYGPQAVAVGTAVLLRLALEIGPADWRLLATDELPDAWHHLSQLTHLRAQPLIRDDLETQVDNTLHDVILVTDLAHVVHRHTLPFRYLESHQASLMMCAPTQRDLPALCTDIIDSTNIELDGVSSESAKNIVCALSRWHDPDARSLLIPRLVRLPDVAGSSYHDSQALRQRWSSASLSVDIGLTAEGPIAIDLAADGPHMVVVGTTGSGKSEFLRSFVLSIALRTSPANVNFILFDYKGGAAFDACVQLPHVVGVVTDLDLDDGKNKVATRVLSGLEAELRRRETVLRRAGCGDQKEYQRKRNRLDEPMPRLVVVVDELAALRADIPEVVVALIAIAQRGRSLGLHLVLATQRPGTELTPDVMANANIRLALRLQTREDSVQVIGHPGAADLPRSSPGRALVRFGSERPEEFQALSVAEELAALVNMTCTVALEVGISRPYQPWCSPLPAKLVSDIRRDRFTVGVVDDPKTQDQFPLRWDAHRHLLVTTGPSMGKTWSLHTLAGVSSVDEPKTRPFFISGRGDQDPKSSWVAVGDRERLHRILHFLTQAIDERRLSPGPLERIRIFVDDVDLWRSHHTTDRVGLMHWELFERIFVEGPPVGVTCVMTAAYDQSLPPVFRARMEQRWQTGTRPGNFSVSNVGSSPALLAQLYDPHSFAEDMESLIIMTDSDRDAVLSVLPTNPYGCDRHTPDAFGIRGDTLTEIRLEANQVLRLLILGLRASGRTTVLRALIEAWTSLHPDGVVLEGEHVDDEERCRFAPDGSATGRPTLIAIDDADRRSFTSSLSAELTRIASFAGPPTASTLGKVSLIATASPHGIRSQPDHWLHPLRRSRSGVLLGRSAEEDGDLLGQYSRHLDVIPRALARGVWIEDGESLGVVQFYRPSS